MWPPRTCRCAGWAGQGRQAGPLSSPMAATVGHGAARVAWLWGRIMWRVCGHPMHSHPSSLHRTPPVQPVADPEAALVAALPGLDAPSAEWVATVGALTTLRQLLVHHRAACAPRLPALVPLVLKSVRSLRSSVCKVGEEGAEGGEGGRRLMDWCGVLAWDAFGNGAACCCISRNPHLDPPHTPPAPPPLNLSPTPHPTHRPPSWPRQTCTPPLATTCCR